VSRYEAGKRGDPDVRKVSLFCDGMLEIITTTPSHSEGRFHSLASRARALVQAGRPIAQDILIQAGIDVGKKAIGL
jgi:hypothetical protein